MDERDAGLALGPRLARAAYALCAGNAWNAFGYVHRGDYCRERLQRSSRWLHDHATLGAAIVRLPAIETALVGRDGPPLGRVVATAIARIATPDNVDVWIQRARRASVRAFLEEVRAHRADRGAAGGHAGRSTLEQPEPEIEDVARLRLQMPAAVAAAFEEVLDLHRSVSGGDVGVADFVEALIAEAVAGPAAPDVADPEANRSSDDGVHGDGAEGDRGVEAHPSAAVDAGVGGDVETTSPLELEQQLLWLLQLESARERRLGRLLYEMDVRGDWRLLGFASVGQYAVERLGMARRTVESRVGIVRALRRLPVIDRAYESGRIGLESAWLLVRIFGSTRPDSMLQQVWVDHAERVTVKRLRDEWRRLRLRDLAVAQGEASDSGDPTDPAAPRPATDDEWYASLHRSPGRSRERLRALRIPAATPRASADVCLRLRLPVDLARAFLCTIESARQRTDVIAARIPWHEPWAAETPASLRAAHAFADNGRGSPPWVGLLALLEDYVDTWDDPRGFPRRQWDAIYSRAGWRCEAPGCTARVRIEDHHIHYRSHQGSNQAWNQLCLCRAHHQQGEHGELARCRGKAPLQVLWRLGKNETASWYRNETRLDAPGPCTAQTPEARS